MKEAIILFLSRGSLISRREYRIQDSRARWEYRIHRRCSVRVEFERTICRPSCWRSSWRVCLPVRPAVLPFWRVRGQLWDASCTFGVRCPTPHHCCCLGPMLCSARAPGRRSLPILACALGWRGAVGLGFSPSLHSGNVLLYLPIDSLDVFVTSGAVKLLHPACPVVDYRPGDLVGVCVFHGSCSELVATGN
jgi:hypothetical protein